MKITIRNIFVYSFKTVCVIVVACMVSYWFYKFEIEDRDIAIVDSVAFEEADDVEFPIASMCFSNPFLDGKLNETDPTINIYVVPSIFKRRSFQRKF